MLKLKDECAHTDGGRPPRNPPPHSIFCTCTNRYATPLTCKCFLCRQRPHPDPPVPHPAAHRPPPPSLQGINHPAPRPHRPLAIPTRFGTGDDAVPAATSPPTPPLLPSLCDDAQPPPPPIKRPLLPLILDYLFHGALPPPTTTTATPLFGSGLTLMTARGAGPLRARVRFVRRLCPGGSRFGGGGGRCGEDV